ncbi:putative glucan 1,3-beta-glucosidase A [Triticum urartu]|uniref:Putative glucan 1,3-beta-glucosidase A n=1 Tax=Triticum urartu TaxID=4572 RepID=M7YN41_TRIUA|nr:putative glucan 1,3-beta-glucosidase A [Triticum urartu]
MRSRLFHSSSLLVLCFLSRSSAVMAAAPRLPVRAVNLGGWLVTEGWILPSLFDGIPNNDLLDGTQLQFKSVTQNAYVAAENGGGAGLVANRPQASGWETFKLWRINEANKDASLTADYGQSTSWGDDDPSVFAVTRVTGLQGEYQLCNGYGTAKATPILRVNTLSITVPTAPLADPYCFNSELYINHWSTYIVEADFRFISESGLTAVRIPVGWWIANDPRPPAPYIGGSLKTLDKAFKWAEKYNLGVIIDLHAAPGSQNPFEHSSSKDGSQDWGTTDTNIAQTVQVIDFLASRYAKSPSLLAVELMNEPLAPGVSLESLKTYYLDGYNTVRKHSSDAYVIMSNRLSSPDPTELLGLAGGLPGSVIDVHYYTLFNNMFDTFTVQQNIDFIKTNYSSDLSIVTRENGPLTFVGEWVAEWKVPNAVKQEFQMFANAQMDVYGRATFG